MPVSITQTDEPMYTSAITAQYHRSVHVRSEDIFGSVSGMELLSLEHLNGRGGQLIGEMSSSVTSIVF
jgi:hypothetical protein